MIDELSFTALAQNAVVGHVTASRAKVGFDSVVAVGPIGVLPDHQAKGIGSALMIALLSAADARDVPLVVLLGSPPYYGRFGFRPAVELGVMPPEPKWGSAFQARPLRAYTPSVAGPFEYAPAFRPRSGQGVCAAHSRTPALGDASRPLRDASDDATMHTSQIQPAVDAAVSIASALDLSVDDAVVLHDSNRVALRLRPCDVLARVARGEGRGGAEFEVEVARRLAETDSPVASLDPRVEPRVYVRDGFVITLWTYYEPGSHPDVGAAEYAQALERLHAGMRQVDFIAPHFTDRVAEAQSHVDSYQHAVSLLDALALERAVDAGWTSHRKPAKPHSDTGSRPRGRRSRRVVDARWTSRPEAVTTSAVRRR